MSESEQVPLPDCVFHLPLECKVRAHFYNHRMCGGNMQIVTFERGSFSFELRVDSPVEDGCPSLSSRELLILAQAYSRHCADESDANTHSTMQLISVLAKYVCVAFCIRLHDAAVCAVALKILHRFVEGSFSLISQHQAYLRLLQWQHCNTSACGMKRRRIQHTTQNALEFRMKFQKVRSY
jgi:hypothetical protein